MFKILNVLLTSWLIEPAFTQSDILCSGEIYSWNNAMQNCRSVVHGTPMSFNGITGKNIEQLNIRPDVTVWTSEYFSRDFRENDCLCSFHYITKDNFNKTSDESYSDCDAFRYFFCRNITTNKIEVLNNTWNHSKHCGTFSVNDELKSILKPGFYWTGQTKSKCGKFQDINKWTQYFWPNPILCGAYSVAAGCHYRICSTKLRYVYASSGKSSPEQIGDSCFLANTTGSTDLSKATTFSIKSYQTQSTKISENVISTDSVLSRWHTQSSKLSTANYVTPSDYTTKVPQISTKRIQNTSETQLNNNITLGHARGSAHEHGDPDTGAAVRQDVKSTNNLVVVDLEFAKKFALYGVLCNLGNQYEEDAGTIAGIVVGVCLVLAVGIALFMYIQRRYRCLFDKNTTSNSKPKTNNSTSNLSKKSKSRTLFNNLAYDSWDDNQKQTRTKRNNTESPNNWASSTNHHRTLEDKDPYYNQSNATYVNDITKQQPTEASSYSFAVETESNVGKNEMSLEEYDTTISTRKGVYKTENVYNKFEPVNNSSSDVYDSTLHQGQSFDTDEVYNKLSCNTKYGQFGTICLQLALKSFAFLPLTLQQFFILYILKNGLMIKKMNYYFSWEEDPIPYYIHLVL